MKKQRVDSLAGKIRKRGKPINVGNVDQELWARFVRVAKDVHKGTVAQYLEAALREKLERDGF
jgi:hypothetical protein